MKTALLLGLLLILTPQALGLVDLVTPADDHLTGAQDQAFEYFPSLANVTSCTLSVGNQTFTDTTIQNNAFNEFTVVNIAQGTHQWRISCENGATTDLSVIRTLTVDRTPPAVDITAIDPATGEATYTVTDGTSTSFTCTANSNATYVSTFTATAGQNTETLALPNGEQTVMLSCLDDAGNAGSDAELADIDVPPPPLALSLTTNKASYALGEPVLLTIDTADDAALDIQVCPNETGFVQCYTPIATGPYPQQMALPYTNTSGEYLIEGVAIRDEQVATDTATYEVTNTMTVRITADREPELDRTVRLTATASGAIGGVTYAWNLSNGTAATGRQQNKTYAGAGTFTERVTATDSAGNTATATYRAEIEPSYTVTVLVKDAATGTRLKDAMVHFELDNGDTYNRATDNDGKAVFVLEKETYQLFVTRDGYDYSVNDALIDKGGEIEILLTPLDDKPPAVTLAAIPDPATVPVTVGFNLDEAGTSTCTLSYGKQGDAWLQEGGTTQATGSGSFTLTSLEEATYTFVIECTDANGNRGESPTGTFTVRQQAQAQAPAAFAPTEGDDALGTIDRAYGEYDSFGRQQKEIADLLGWEETLKQTKRAVERSERDINAVTFRRDLTEEEIREKQAELAGDITESVRTLPVDIQVLETKTQVAYPDEEERAAFAHEIKKLKGYALEPEEVEAYLAGLQKDFTMKTTLVRAAIIRADGSRQPISIVTHDLTYGFEPDERYTVYEAVPDGFAPNAKAVTTVQDAEALSQQPLRLEFAAEESITYYAAKDVPMDALVTARTVLLKRPTQEDLKAITGNFLLGGAVDWKASLVLSLLLALAVYLFRRFDLSKHLGFLTYEKGAHKGAHAVRTLINDAADQLNTDLDAAMMRFKEAKLSYERLGTYAKNEVYDDLMELKGALDAQYFARLTDRIKEHLDNHELEAAIQDYERLEGTYDLLPKQEQQRLYEIVLELGKRLGGAA